MGRGGWRLAGKGPASGVALELAPVTYFVPSMPPSLAACPKAAQGIAKPSAFIEPDLGMGLRARQGGVVRQPAACRCVARAL